MTENLINHKRYIGQKKSSTFLETRYLGSGKILKQAIEKYGRQNFSVTLLECCKSKEELNAREVYWISRYNAQHSREFYNICKGGEAGPGGPNMLNKKHPPHSKVHEFSDRYKGSNNPNYGNHWKASEKTRELMRKNNSGKGNPSYGKKLMNNGLVSKRVLPDEIPTYLEQGWELGSLKYKRRK